MTNRFPGYPQREALTFKTPSMGKGSHEGYFPRLQLRSVALTELTAQGQGPEVIWDKLYKYGSDSGMLRLIRLIDLKIIGTYS